MNELENTPKKESPIDAALSCLENNIGKLKVETLPKFESVLASVLTEPEKSIANPETTAASQTSLEMKLMSMNDNVQEIDEYLRSLQNRVQL